LAGLILLGRFLVSYVFFDEGSRYIQSVSIGGTLLTAGITLIMFGFLGMPCAPIVRWQKKL
jgi:hypothetical protein